MQLARIAYFAGMRNAIDTCWLALNSEGKLVRCAFLFTNSLHHTDDTFQAVRGCRLDLTSDVKT